MSNVGESRSVDGSLFQAFAPATANDLSPILVFVAGTRTSIDEEDRSFRRDC